MKAVESVAKSFGNTPKFVKDLRAINDDKGVDVVSIATRTIGIRWRPFGPCKRAKMFIAKSPSATTSVKVGVWCKLPAN